MKSTVFFDAGHTLLHPNPGIGEIYAEHARAIGVDVDPEIFDHHLSPAWIEHHEAARHDPSIPTSTSDDQDVAMWTLIARRVYDRIPEMQDVSFQDWFLRIYTAFGAAKTWAVFDDVEETLVKLKERECILGIISNWSSRLVHILVELDLAKHFDTLSVSSIVGARKPDAKIFQDALSKTGSDPATCLHIGDIERADVEGAAAVGITGILIDRHQRNHHVEPRVGSLIEVLDYV